MKVAKAAAQVLNTLWQYRDLRAIYKKVRGWDAARSQCLTRRERQDSSLEEAVGSSGPESKTPDQDLLLTNRFSTL